MWADFYEKINLALSGDNRKRKLTDEYWQFIILGVLILLVIVILLFENCNDGINMDSNNHYNLHNL